MVTANLYNKDMPKTQVPKQLKPHVFKKGNKLSQKEDLPFSERLFIRLNKNQTEKLDKMAEASSLTRSEVIRLLLNDAKIPSEN